jgi:hypothetical protein
MMEISCRGQAGVRVCTYAPYIRPSIHIFAVENANPDLKADVAVVSRVSCHLDSFSSFDSLDF